MLEWKSGHAWFFLYSVPSYPLPRWHGSPSPNYDCPCSGLRDFIACPHISTLPASEISPYLWSGNKLGTLLSARGYETLAPRDFKFHKTELMRCIACNIVSDTGVIWSDRDDRWIRWITYCNSASRTCVAWVRVFTYKNRQCLALSYVSSSPICQ